MKSKSIFVLFALATMLAFSVSANETSRSGGPRLVMASVEHSFGVVKPGTPLTYTFEVKNEGEANLEIKNVSPSCGCTTTKFDHEIGAGKSGSITLAVEKTEGYNGEVTKTAAVTTNDPNHPTFTLTLRATLQRVRIARSAATQDDGLGSRPLRGASQWAPLGRELMNDKGQFILSLPYTRMLAG